MQEFLVSLRKKVQEWRKDFNKRENEASEKMRTYLRLLPAKDSPELQRLKALIGKESVYESGDRRASDLILLSNLHVLAEYVNVHGVLIEQLDRELEESGIREVVKDIKAIKELVKKIKELKKRAENVAAETEKREKELKRKLVYIS